MAAAIALRSTLSIARVGTQQRRLQPHRLRYHQQRRHLPFVGREIGAGAGRALAFER